MLKTYPKFKRNEIEKIFSKLSKESQEEINKYIAYRESTGLEDSSDVKRYVIQIRYIIGCEFRKFNTLNDVVSLSNIIKDSYLSKSVKTNLKINLKNLFQYFYPDWTSRFMGLKCFSNKISKGKKSREEETYSAADLPTEEEDKKILQTEKTNYWKTFFIVHSQSGNRTIETRFIENDKINFTKDGCEIEIFMTKNGKKKYNILNLQAANYIKKLQQEQKNIGTYGKYLFNSPENKDIPIHKNMVNFWYRNITKKATGRTITPYTWRHRKATHLYSLATENKISMDAAAQLMGHNSNMAITYVHRPDEKTIEILKQQLKNINEEISPEKKHILEEQIEKLTSKIDKIEKEYIKLKEIHDLQKKYIVRSDELNNQVSELMKIEIDKLKKYFKIQKELVNKK